MPSNSSNLYVLLDATFIIQAHVCGVWDQLMAQMNLVVPSAVWEESQHFIDNKTSEQWWIHLERSLDQGLLRKVEATQGQIAALRLRFDDIFLERIHAGEEEALALLLAGQLPEHRFCTSDGPAIKALALLEMSDVGISFEAILHNAGFNSKTPKHFTERFFREQLDRGAQERITGVGLRAKPSSPKAPRAGRKKRP